MFITSKTKATGLLVSTGELTIGNDFLRIKNYPFEPSIAFRQTTFIPQEIEEIDFKSYPPTIRIKDELIFLATEKKSELGEFANKNGIKTVERKEIWGWILEPFLDTEFTEETNQRLFRLLENYGLTTEQVKALRAEVEIQMLKYNFDTMLWEWGGFSACDVLKAMRTKYDENKYREFYRRVMAISLLSEKTEK